MAVLSLVLAGYCPSRRCWLDWDERALKAWYCVLKNGLPGLIFDLLTESKAINRHCGLKVIWGHVKGKQGLDMHTFGHVKEDPENFSVETLTFSQATPSSIF